MITFNDYYKVESSNLMAFGRLGIYGVMYAVNEFLVRESGKYAVVYFAFGPYEWPGLKPEHHVPSWCSRSA